MVGNSSRGRLNQGASLVAHVIKTLPAMWETRLQSLGLEDSLGEGNSYPLQYTYLECPVGRGA